MTTTTAIITDAYRESNLIMIGGTPTSDQQTEGMAALARLIAAVYGSEVGENLRDWTVGQEHAEDPDLAWTSNSWKYPVPNSRILLDHGSAQTIYLPMDPDNGARICVIDVFDGLGAYNVTLDGNGRTIEGVATKLLSTNGVNSTWAYSADTANWALVEGLELGDVMPFPTEFDDYFITKLAMRLNPRYGRALSDLTLATLAEVKETLEARYRQTMPQPVAKALQRTSTPNRYLSSAPRVGKFGWMR